MNQCENCGMLFEYIGDGGSKEIRDAVLRGEQSLKPYLDDTVTESIM